MRFANSVVQLRGSFSLALVVFMRRRGDGFRVPEFARKLIGMMDKNGHALGTNPGFLPVVTELNQRNDCFGAGAIEAVV